MCGALRAGFAVLAVAALAVAADPPPPAQTSLLARRSVKPDDDVQQGPRSWLPMDESLRFKIEVDLGPVRGLDVGSVTLSCVQAPEIDGADEASAASELGARRLIASIDGVAKGAYLGREVHHAMGVRWYEGNRPRIECFERLTGTRHSERELSIGETENGWKLEYRKDRHCKGCNDRAHFVDGSFFWSKPSHCDDCHRPDHRVWRDYTYLEVPPDSVDVFSALYFARGFLRSTAESTSLALVNQAELWTVSLRRGGSRKIETPAGEFDCVRVLIAPKIAVGDGPGKKASARFEALFGLHGDISVWVDKRLGIPVLIQGTAPLGPFDLHVTASLTSHRGG